MLKLYEKPASGNCMKARILLRHLEILYESVERVESRPGFVNELAPFP